MADVYQVLQYFSVLSGLPLVECQAYEPLCQGALSQVLGQLKAGVDVQAQAKRICFYAAVQALCSYSSLLQATSCGGFQVGEISVSPSATLPTSLKDLQESQTAAMQDLLRPNFVFRQVMSK